MIGLLEWLDTKGFYTKTVWDVELNRWTGPGNLQLFDFQRRILGHCFTPDEDGNLPYSTIVYSTIKKSGKTQLEALVLAWAAETGPDGSEVFAIANDIDQAQARAFSDIVYHVEHKLGLEPTRYRIDYENGSYIQAIAQHYASAAGARQYASGWDELWAYMCIEAGTPVLTADLRWVPIEDLRVGDELIAFDEERQGAYRSFRKTRVVETGRCRASARRFHLSDGKEFVCSRDHRMLVKRGKRHAYEWQDASDIRVGDSLIKLSDVWSDERSYESGYLAAAFDGEGSLVQNEREGWRLDFAQRDNEMLHEVMEYLTSYGFRWWDANRDGDKRKCKNLGLAEKHQVMRFLGSIRPKRLLAKVDPDKLGRMTAVDCPKVVQIDELPDEWPLVSVTTDSHTLIAGGYAAHNSERSRRMWAEMTPPPSVPNSFRFIATYAGFENESDQLLELYNMCFKEEHGEYVNGEDVPELADIVDSKGRPVCRRNGKTFIYWDHEPRMPWQTPEYYEEQMMTLRPVDFLRMHRNMWVSSTESFIPIELWDRAARKLEGPLTLFKEHPYRQYPISVGIDIGMKHDCSALTGVYYDAGRRKAGLAFHYIWTPPNNGEVLDLEFTVEMMLERLWKEFRIIGVYYDPTQFQRSSTTLTRKGLPMVEFPQTAGNMVLATQAFYDLLKTENFEAYPDPEMRDHVRYASAETTARGFRLVKGRNAKYKIDAAIALAMAIYGAVNSGGVDSTEPVQVISPFADFSGVRIPTVGDLYQRKLPEALRD